MPTKLKIKQVYPEPAATSNSVLTGTPTAPTPSTNDDSTKIATTAYVKSNLSSYLPLAGGTMTGALSTNSDINLTAGKINITTNSTNTSHTTTVITATTGTNDSWRIASGATASNAGFMEIATADDGSEPIYVRQYSGSYATLKRTATLLDGSGNTSFPGTVTATTFSGALSGNATSATAFSAAKSVTLTGAVTGTASSTAGWSVPTLWRSCMVGQSGSSTTNPWYKVATIACTTANWDPQITFLVEQTYYQHNFGILRIHIRTNGSKVIDTSATTIKWLVNYGFTVGDFVLACPTAASSTAELWTKIGGGYIFRRFVVLSEGTRTDTSMIWTLLNASSAGQAASITTSGTQITSTT